MEARIDQYLDELDAELSADDSLREAIETLEEVASQHNMTIGKLIPWGRGRGWSIMFAWQANETYIKYLQTDRFPTLVEAINHSIELLSEVEDLMPNIFKIGDLFKYLTAEMLPRGKATKLTIERVEVDELENQRGKQTRAIVYFKGTDKGWVVGNKTNARALERLFGTPETDEWVGREVQLVRTEVNAFGKTVDAIRVKE